MAKEFYIPEGITEDYKYIVPNGDYYDLYDTFYLENGQTYKFYRFYNNLEKDLFQENYITPTTNTTLNTIEIIPKNNYIYRQDYKDIIITSAILIIGLVILINILTSIIKRGGVLSGLF